MLLTFSGILFNACSGKNKAEAAEFFERGNYHFKKREYQRAIELFSEAIEKVPDFADAYNNRGLCHEEMANPAQAIADYEKAVELDDSFSQAKLNMARALIHSGETDKSGKLLEELQNKYKDSTAYYDYRGQWDLLKNQMDAALSDFNQAILLGGESVEVLTNLGFAFYQKRDLKSAKNYFEKGLKLNPNFGFALNNLSATYGRLNQWDKALSYSEKAIKADPTELSFINTHTLNLLETEHLKQAAELIDKSLKLAPDSPYSLRNKAILLVKSERNNEAIDILQSIEQKNPEVEFIYYYLAKASSDKASSCRYFERGKTLGDLRCEKEAERC